MSAIRTWSARVRHAVACSAASAIWFRLNHPLLEGEPPSPYQRVLVAADSGNGISAVLDLATHSFVNSDLTVHLLRRPVGEWIALDARTALGTGGSRAPAAAGWPNRRCTTRRV